MVLPIGGFMPIPLAMMIPFMATQSLVMGDAFGKAFQFGKRKISAMSNEEFNKLTLTDLVSNMQTDFKLAIPKLEQSINDSQQLQQTIIAEMLKILPQFITSDANKELGQDIASVFGTEKSDTNPTGGIPWNDIVKALMYSATTQMLGYKRTGNSQVDLTTSQGPSQNINIPPTNTFQNIQDLLPQIGKNLQTPEQLAEINKQKLLALKTLPTADAIRRNKIAESGLSPVAFNARETFKSNIDNQVAYLAKLNKTLSSTQLQISYAGKRIANPQVGYLKTAQGIAVKKLSALRIKFQQVYGFHY